MVQSCLLLAILWTCTTVYVYTLEGRGSVWLVHLMAPNCTRFWFPALEDLLQTQATTQDLCFCFRAGQEVSLFLQSH